MLERATVALYKLLRLIFEMIHETRMGETVVSDLRILKSMDPETEIRGELNIESLGTPQQGLLRYQKHRTAAADSI